MDALILSCGTGGGHNSAGKAVKEELDRRGHHTVMMNPYLLYSDKLARRIDETYIRTATRAPKAFGAVYGAGELYRKLPFPSPVYFVNRGMISRMQRYLEEHPFQIVIMPHLFPAEILTNMKHCGLEIPRTMFVATDYCCIPFTEETECDVYVVPGAEAADDFAGRGIPEEKIYPCGIPVDRSFAEAEKREEARGRLGLAPDKKYILIAGGSIGAGKIEKLIGLLLDETEKRREVELIAVCGRNQELYGRLEQRYRSRMTVVGHTERMAEYLKASDLYITKPGGLSSTEAAVCGIPLLHMPPIPGCETFNARFFSQHHMSRACEVTKSGAKAVLELLYQEDICTEMMQNQRRFINRNAAVQICELAERLAWGLSGSFLDCRGRWSVES